METFAYFCKWKNEMEKLFEVQFLEDAYLFLKNMEPKHSEKIIYNIHKAQIKNDPELLKKLTDDIWELRTLYQGNQYRLLAFWDKTNIKSTLVIATHGFIKKQSKVASKEILKAKKIQLNYFKEKD
ncbi:type II toxin-antitoxin system RelE/ParE family toxin [Flavobacterium sp. UGB4466]|uniref:type II toxin-antitoxin system RelE/ParE family toxin n=1 Tax=Flavobacterium sp. UGB4466 TaxID=2730889 RepID=UPI001ED96776|nr:type II toxin-antitoxin system RelE/ParE family toxin [Flavobacterium sp. UGB4466]